MTKYKLLGHLGTKREEDQRLAKDEAGNFYLYDWSGSSPDRTDDGPCMIDLSKPAKVGVKFADIAVICRGGNYSTSVLTCNFMKLKVQVPGLRAEPTPELKALYPLVTLLRAKEIEGSGLEYRASCTEG